MADEDRLSYARNVEGLQQTPTATDRQVSAKSAFDHARDPLISRQIQDMERQSREGQGRPSSMVASDRPQAQAKPSEELARPQTTKDFDRAWMREQRAAAQHQKYLERYGNRSGNQQGNAQADSQHQSARHGQK